MTAMAWCPRSPSIVSSFGLASKLSFKLPTPTASSYGMDNSGLWLQDKYAVDKGSLSRALDPTSPRSPRNFWTDLPTTFSYSPLASPKAVSTKEQFSKTHVTASSAAQTATPLSPIDWHGENALLQAALQYKSPIWEQTQQTEDPFALPTPAPALSVEARPKINDDLQAMTFLDGLLTQAPVQMTEIPASTDLSIPDFLLPSVNDDFTLDLHAVETTAQCPSVLQDVQSHGTLKTKRSLSSSWLPDVLISAPMPDAQLEAPFMPGHARSKSAPSVVRSKSYSHGSDQSPYVIPNRALTPMPQSTITAKSDPSLAVNAGPIQWIQESPAMQYQVASYPPPMSIKPNHAGVHFVEVNPLRYYAFKGKHADRDLVASACDCCRSQKRRCERPMGMHSCTRCHRMNKVCNYSETPAARRRHASAKANKY